MSEPAIRVEGAELVRAVDLLCAADLTDLAASELQRLTVTLSAARSRLAAVQSAALAELADRTGGRVLGEPGPDGAPGRAVLLQHWWRDATGDGGPAAGSDVRTAGLLARLPLVRAAVLDGRLAMSRAVVLTRLVGQIDPAALAEAEPSLVQVALERDPQALADWVRHQLATWCEPRFEADQRSQDAKRYLQTRREPDGMLSGRFRLTTADAETVLTVLEPLARPAGLADGRSAGQRRADALVEVFGQVARFGDLPDAGGLRPQVSYLVPAGWAAGRDRPGSFTDLVRASLPTAAQSPIEPLWTRPVEHACATGAWTGPQTRARIEQVLCDARLTRVLLDTRGQVRGLEALGDTITATQRQALRARDKGCAVRGCTRPPAFCDAHHLDHRADGGETSIDNLVLLCRRHHTLWHQGQLTLHHLHVPWITGTHDPPF